MAPSPTGSPHVGLARTALFNWAFARHHGGTFVFRVEDTDKERSTEESLTAIIEVFRWLGLDWDEGPEVGGAYAPYKQSERGDLYADALARLRAGGYTYDCYCTTEELDARHEVAKEAAKAAITAAKAAAAADPEDAGLKAKVDEAVTVLKSQVLGYDGFCRALTEEQVAGFAGRAAVVRFRMPEGRIGWDDLVRQEISFDTKHVPDYALARPNGDPLYTLVNPVDDALMEITHVLRGEDLLSSTPRQIALYDALAAVGIGNGTTPRFGHLPYVMGEGNKKLSKRDPGASLLGYREDGFVAEGLLNYLALLGWSVAADRDVFGVEELVEKFDIADVNANPARFDLKKAEAINASHLRLLSLDEITHRVLPFLKAAGVVSDPVSDADARLLELAMPLIAERINKLTEAPEMLGFLFADEVAFDADDVANVLDEDGRAVVAASREALTALTSWSTADIEAALRAKLVEELGIKPKNAFGPVRVAITGRRISPPLFESLELLGRDVSLARLDAVLG
ncbi:glutamate--tRNA ligase [Nocardioides marmoriginsengisoli]|uniref:Glutamate--tRNA ligase n=2 Tax=Nocardioides marmoriginsengisoli TaxID=661483 RepID=A0A3N0CPV7_9ACTN|nr:glutamate--tRNA ligase [Nocardioides marmoriginsengisoli]